MSKLYPFTTIEDDETWPEPRQVALAIQTYLNDDALLRCYAERLEIRLQAVPALLGLRYFVTPDEPFARMVTFDADHIGPKIECLALPIFDQKDELSDLLTIDSYGHHHMALRRAIWLGESQLSGKTVRLHASPLEWLQGGCVGVCHVSPIFRGGFEALRGVDEILCNDIYTAFEAWDWGFGSDPDALDRFVIDANPINIRTYFEELAYWRAATISREALYNETHAR